MKKLCGAIAVVGLLTILIFLVAACGSATASGPNQIHMNDITFEQSSITIKKGERITLVNDVAAVHIVQNGNWDTNGNAQPKKEPGAPTVDAQIKGYDYREFGPFATPGTFQIFCPIHPGMKLTIVVK